MAIERVRTGIDGLDTLLGGGLIPKRSYIVAGPPGSGKTLLSLQFLAQGTKERKRSLYITLDDPPNEVKMNTQSLNLDLRQVHVIDSIPDVKSYDITMVKDVASVREVQVLSSVSDVIRKTNEFKALEASIPSLQQTLKLVCQQKGYDRIVIDSLTALLYYALKGEEEHATVQSFMRFMMDLNATILLTIESNSLSPYEPYVFLSRGAIRLWKWWEKGRLCRALSVEKFKGSSYEESPRVMEITRSGIVVYPDREIMPPVREIESLIKTKEAEDETDTQKRASLARVEKRINPYLKRDMG